MCDSNQPVFFDDNVAGSHRPERNSTALEVGEANDKRRQNGPELVALE